MTIIKLTHCHRELREIKGSFSWWRPVSEISFDYVNKWDKHPTFHTVNNCSFTAATNNIDGQEVKGSIFNGYFVKETPEEILKLIQGANNASKN